MPELGPPAPSGPDLPFEPATDLPPSPGADLPSEFSPDYASNRRRIDAYGGEIVHVVGLLGGRPVGAAAEEALAAARLVAGGRDQLTAVAGHLGPEVETVVVGAGLGAIERIAEHPGPVCVLASGDPGYWGIGRALGARLGPQRLRVHPAPSSVSLAFARLGLAWEDAVVRSCHQGGAARVAAEVVAAPRAAVLCGPTAPPEAVGAALAALGAPHRLVAVCTRLGEPGERVERFAGAGALAAGRYDHRSIVVVAHNADGDGGGPPAQPAGGCGAARPVEAFAHRASMITKPEVRAVVLARLELPDAGVLWDVGAGSGSVAVEAALAAPGLRVVAVEREPADAERIVANAAGLGALVDVVVGEAPAALAGLPEPDRVFVGGGGLDVLEACHRALRPGGRLVATFAALDRALGAHARLGSMVQVRVDRAEPLPDGGVRLAADNPVFVAWGDASRPTDAAGATAAADVDHSTLAVGVGCSSTTSAAELAALFDDAWAQLPATARLDRPPTVTTIDRRAGHPAVLAVAAGRRLVSFPASLLSTVDVPHPSPAVEAAVGTPSVAEAAALLAAGPRARLLVTKQTSAGATVAIAVAGGAQAAAGRLQIVGLGPGGAAHRTPGAVAALRGADAVVGYGPYVEAVADLLQPRQRVVRGAMGAEAERAVAALSLARAGWQVALVSSGDSGVFGMAAVTLELAPEVLGADHGEVPIDVVPGVTAAQAAAARAGAPLAGPYAVLTLSDLLVPFAMIERQLRAAAGAGLALALYNPNSLGRPDHLERARRVLLEVLDPTSPVVVATDVGGPSEQLVTTTLVELRPEEATMRSVVLVGSAETVVAGGRVVTARHHPRPTSTPAPAGSPGGAG